MRVILRAAPGVEKLGSVMSDPAGSFNAKAVYGQASRAYEDASSEFWAYLSTRTVDRIGLSPGQRVLDVACGTGPALIAAAERVGPRGRVVGLDYAEEMVALARTKILDRGLDNVEVRVGDMTSVDEVEVAYDAVMCVLGIFFVDDMAGVLDCSPDGPAKEVGASPSLSSGSTSSSRCAGCSSMPFVRLHLTSRSSNHGGARRMKRCFGASSKQPASARSRSSLTMTSSRCRSRMTGGAS
jgi:Methyltransferase domain